MKQSIVLLAIFVLLAVTGFGQPPENIATQKATSQQAMLLARERGIWDAVKKKRIDMFRSFFREDYQGVYGVGIRTIKKEIEGIRSPDFTLLDFTMASTSVRFPNETTGVITYKGTYRYRSKEKEQVETYQMSSVWIKQQGKWLNMLHTEAKVQ